MESKAERLVSGVGSQFRTDQHSCE